MNTELGLFLLRVAAGAMLLTHSIPKLTNFRATLKWIASENIPLPVLSTLYLIAAETIGAVLVILGVYTSWVAMVIAGSMTVAVFTHLRKGESFKQMEDAVLYLVMFLVLAIAGGGAWTLV